MIEKYDLAVTWYRCTRCRTPIEVPSDSFYRFSGAEDPAFWCPTCEDMPQAAIVGTPAADLPPELQLPNGFVLRSVPSAKPGDVFTWNVLFRPYSKRSFLRQYRAWLALKSDCPICALESDVSVRAKFDPEIQRYSAEIETTISDICAGAPCQFLARKALQHEEVQCTALRALCDTRGKFGLCQTGDEAMLLQQYVVLTGDEHFPMLIPQVSILRGARRADFLCFVPVSRFQYQKVAVLVDRPGKDAKVITDEDAAYGLEGFVVKRIVIDPTAGLSYFNRARGLCLWLQAL